MTTILKDVELNYDFNVCMISKKKKEKKNVQQSQIRIYFFLILLNGRVGKYFTNIEYLFQHCNRHQEIWFFNNVAYKQTNATKKQYLLLKRM